MAAGANASSYLTGQGAAAGNSGYFGFHYEGSNNDNNHLTLGLYSYDHLVRIYKTGNVSIGSATNTHKLFVNGNVKIQIPSSDTSSDK